ncbi:MAG: hypothetical protein R3Y06_11950 [Faecalibacterium sp.]
MKYTAKMLLLCLAACVFVGCSASTAEPYGVVRVLRYVIGVCDGEFFTLNSAERICDDPTEDVYYFTTKRGLAFTATSYLLPISIDASVSSFCTKNLKTDYIDAVHALYEDAVAALFPEEIIITQFADVAQIVEDIAAANEIYRAELAYHDADFLSENPLCTLSIRAIQPDGSKYYCLYIPIDGAEDTDAIRAAILQSYCQAVYDGALIDDTIPAEYVAEYLIEME